MTSWVARVEWQTPDPIGEDLDALDFILEQLQGYSACVSEREPGIGEITLSVEADTLDGAVKQALDLVVGATAETPTGIVVLGEETYDRRVAAVPVGQAWA